MTIMVKDYVVPVFRVNAVISFIPNMEAKYLKLNTADLPIYEGCSK